MFHDFFYNLKLQNVNLKTLYNIQIEIGSKSTSEIEECFETLFAEIQIAN